MCACKGGGGVVTIWKWWRLGYRRGKFKAEECMSHHHMLEIYKQFEKDIDIVKVILLVIW